MAQLSSFSITGSLDWSATTENTSSAGYMWFDGTNFKYSTCSALAWSTGGNLSVSRYHPVGIGESKNAMIGVGGRLAPSFNIISCNEEYNGSSWSTCTALPHIGYRLNGFGSSNASGVTGGSSPTTYTCYTEWDGSSWSYGSSTTQCMVLGGGSGTQNSGVTMGSVPTYNYTEEYNGSSWSTGGNLICGRYNSGVSGQGTQNATTFFGGTAPGIAPGALNCTEEYNGSSWATGGAMILGKYNLGGSGTQDAARALAGVYPTYVQCHEYYNGTSWSSDTVLPVGSPQNGGGANGSSNSTLYFNGYPWANTSYEWGQELVVCTL